MADKPVVVGIAEMEVVRDSGKIATYALGSCVGVCLYDYKNKVAGMVHILLPSSSDAIERSNPCKLIGTVLMSMGIKNIFDPANMVTGGVTGAAIIFKQIWNVPLWLSNTLLNIPLFIAAFKIMGWTFIKRTLFATVMLSVALYVIPDGSFMQDDLFLSALFGGIIGGVGIGLVFLARATTGGTDMLAALIQKRMKHYTIAQIMQVLDGLIIIPRVYTNKPRTTGEGYMGMIDLPRNQSHR